MGTRREIGPGEVMVLRQVADGRMHECVAPEGEYAFMWRQVCLLIRRGYLDGKYSESFHYRHVPGRETPRRVTVRRYHDLTLTSKGRARWTVAALESGAERDTS